MKLKDYLRKEINLINNHRLPNTDRTNKLIDLFLNVFKDKTFSFDRYKYINEIHSVTQTHYYNKKKNIGYSFYELYHFFINHFDIDQMTNEEKIKQANRLIKEVLVSEYDDKNLNDSSLKHLEQVVSEKIVNHWYLLINKEVFTNKDKKELNDYLETQNIKKEYLEINL